MSRCFPYPPPGYSLSRASNEALIESIKLQKERQQANEQRKREKRREKEKRKEKKERRKEKKEKTKQDLDKSDQILKSHGGEKYWADTKSEILHEGRATETEQLENSGLTEEHEQPSCLQVPSSSSDSTENSNKRKRLSLPIDSCSRHGNIIKIKLSSKKKNECDASASELPCSASGRINFVAQTKDEISSGVAPQNLSCKSNGNSNIGLEFPLRTDKEQMCSTSVLIDAALPGTPSSPNLVTSSMLQYKNLIENWLPPQLQYTCPDLDDQEWLFQDKSQNACPEKRFRSGDNNISCTSSLVLWPHVQYLHEADVYALPFTVPF